MATFLNIVDVTCFILGLIGLVMCLVGVAYVGGMKGWGIRQMAATVAGSVTFDIPGYKKSTCIITSVASALFCLYFDLMWSFWLQVIVQAIALYANTKIGQYRQALI